jgi:hypothetical protein
MAAIPMERKNYPISPYGRKANGQPNRQRDWAGREEYAGGNDFPTARRFSEIDLQRARHSLKSARQFRNSAIPQFRNSDLGCGKRMGGG